ncbi:hypothetical protein HPB52_011305 [Rhipicephalus sanguineus]|uniref:HTH psq-type domain-containing protein n=1 Tax=Rhipicephalus sanguineus TaxID=34632 RepID=A0A9D4PNM2_RHISA|nr:hypothetical protein HPB52_011305 [Rhipicephalus sanguineus]
MASVKKRENLDFATKLKAIQRAEAGEKSLTVADDIGIPRSTMSTLLKNRANIDAKAAEQRTSVACRVRVPAHDKVEKALYAWFPLPSCRTTRGVCGRFRGSGLQCSGYLSLAGEDIVAAVAGTQDAQADSSCDEEDRPDEVAATRAYSATEVAAAFGLIRRCCGDMEGTGLLHLDSLDKIEASIFNFSSKTKKQAKISDFSSCK